ncbi:MAG: 4Fe-4S binding protein [Burkholderiaceae bacterium]|nr:4Fe-4S binding protein [Burkholderiaceae bacterium]
MDYKLLKNVSPATDEDICTRCGICASRCPTGAISLQGNTMVTDASQCILCCACVKQCLIGARELKDERIDKIRGMLLAKFSERKEPEFFYPSI